MNDNLEGYCDGLAGHAVQPWLPRGVAAGWEYVRGYALGQVDRMVMLEAQFSDMPTWNC